MLLFCVVPPKRSGGVGCSVLEYNLLAHTRRDWRAVLVPSRVLRNDQIHEEWESYHTAPSDSVISKMGVLAVAPSFVFAYLSGLVHCLRYKDRLGSLLLGFSGASWTFLFQLLGYSMGIRGKYCIYLVDDLEASLGVEAPRYYKFFVRQSERYVLRRASGVFVISQGYADHVERKYGIKASVLPTCLPPDFEANFRPLDDRATTRILVFFGSLNHLYLSVLEEVARLVARRNQLNFGVTYVLRIITLGDPSTIINAAGGSGCVQVVRGVNEKVIEDATRDAFAGLLPYSFNEQQRVMVSTSFPTKLIECFRMRRPAVVIAPDYASTSIYARNAQWGWALADYQQFVQWMDEVTEDDARSEWERQVATAVANHSPIAIQSVYRPFEQSSAELHRIV